MTKVVGERVPRYDGLSHVTGRTVFVDDRSFPGMLHMKVFRSPVVKAKILNIDTSKAEKVAGVAYVATHKDVPNNHAADEPTLADEEVRYLGQPIVAVAAVDEDTAQEAVEQIKVDFKEENPVFDPFEAMKPDAPKVRPEGNVLQFGDYPYRPIRLGDVEKGLAEADTIVEGSYRVQNQQHCQMEPHVSIAMVDGTDRFTICTVSQAPFSHQGQIAGTLGVHPSKVQMVGGTVGGGFGSKNDVLVDHVVAVLALRTGRPVKWRWTREEEFVASTCRGAWHMEFKDGVTKDGRIIARKIRSVYDCGAYDLMTDYVVTKHCSLLAGPYAIPNVWIDGYAIFTNKQVSTSMRGFGVNQASFGSEVQMDRVAEAIGMDPWEIRFINAHRNGDITATRHVVDDVSLIETMKAAAKGAGIELPVRLLTMSSDKREE